LVWERLKMARKVRIWRRSAGVNSLCNQVLSKVES
jgi:hypothetical protein